MTEPNYKVGGDQRAVGSVFRPNRLQVGTEVVEPAPAAVSNKTGRPDFGRPIGFFIGFYVFFSLLFLSLFSFPPFLFPSFPSTQTWTWADGHWRQTRTKTRDGRGGRRQAFDDDGRQGKKRWEGDRTFDDEEVGGGHQTAREDGVL